MVCLVVVFGTIFPTCFRLFSLAFFPVCSVAVWVDSPLPPGMKTQSQREMEGEEERAREVE